MSEKFPCYVGKLPGSPNHDHSFATHLCRNVDVRANVDIIIAIFRISRFRFRSWFRFRFQWRFWRRVSSCWWLRRLAVQAQVGIHRWFRRPVSGFWRKRRRVVQTAVDIIPLMELFVVVAVFIHSASSAKHMVWRRLNDSQAHVCLGQTQFSWSTTCRQKRKR